MQNALFLEDAIQEVPGGTIVDSRRRHWEVLQSSNSG